MHDEDCKSQTKPLVQFAHFNPSHGEFSGQVHIKETVSKNLLDSHTGIGTQE